MNLIQGIGSAAIAVLVAASASAQSSGDAARETARAADEAISVLEALRDATLLEQHGLQAPSDADYPAPDAEREELGRLLFFDKILSGNRNISCATCHHPLAATGDGLSLSVGEGGQGLGVARGLGGPESAVHERVPRNAPPIFNLGAVQFTRMFHDGRVEIAPDHPSGFRSPAGDDLPAGLDSLLAVQAMFPVTSDAEMAGQPGENEIADAAAAGDLTEVWALLADRLRGIPEYVTRFAAVFDDVSGAGDITFAHAARAIAAYEAAAYRADGSPFDRFLRGDHRAMSREARRGMAVFYGGARCGDCHAGTFQTDERFYAIAMPQIGPGKGDSSPGWDDGREDFGRERVTGDPADRFRFRVPTLRNVAITAPYGHDGAYDTLESIVRHHLRPVISLHTYDPVECTLPPREDLDAIDFIVQSTPARRHRIAAANELAPSFLSDRQVKDLVAFLHALTDPASLDMRRKLPMSVPSGLPVAD